MEYIAHRVNKKEDLDKLHKSYGVEIDLRDNINGSIYLEHDPFQKGEDFEDYLRGYHHGTMILNVKSERIEYRILELLKKYNIDQYFFLDCTFPMIKALSDADERKIALRYSEYEGMDTLIAMQGKVEWVWIDCFHKLPLYQENYKRIKEMGYRLCLVSPELQGQEEKLAEYAQQIREEGIEPDAICTKSYHIDSWKQKLGL